MNNLRERALQIHEEKRGKIEIAAKVAVNNREDLSLAYTPGVAEPCREIASNSEAVYQYTNKGNTVAVVTDGSAVLGLGNLGPLGAYPVMEGKALLFKTFADIDAIPICLDTQCPEQVVQVVQAIAPSFGGINLEDIAAPRCFTIEEQLIKSLDIPVFHDDQHGTAVVVLAAVINALKVVHKELNSVRVVINGIGAAGSAICELLLEAGVKDIILVDRHGIIYPGHKNNTAKQEKLALVTNKNRLKGSLSEALEKADVFIGVSRGNLLTPEMLSRMAEHRVVFAMANPEPEIRPEDAKVAGAAVVGTGRSDYPNQINNVLAFPGIFRGALDVRARQITTSMKLAAAHAIAGIVTPQELNADYIIPDVFDKRVVARVAEAVAQAAVKDGVARTRRFS